MIRKFLKKLVYYVANNNYTEEERERMEYALITITFELIKMIVLILIFSLMGYFKEILIIVFIMCAVKPFIGGYHEDSQIKCFIATLLLTTGELILSLNSILDFKSNCIIVFISIFCIWNQAPVINAKMPITRPELIRKNRIIGLSTTMTLGITSIFLQRYTSYYALITWTILFHAILMFNKREKNVKL